MSVLVTGKFHGDVDTFRKAVSERADEIAQVADRARAAGCLHHRFGIGDGFVVLVDEWDTAEAFEKFFGAPELQQLVSEMGASPDVPPEIAISEAISTADQF
jgi:quinol monooxygenase YgiN